MTSPALSFTVADLRAANAAASVTWATERTAQRADIDRLFLGTPEIVP